MKISFYVLGDRYALANGTEKDSNSTASNSEAVDYEAVLSFVCKLTQTVLAKSDDSLIIVDDDIDRLQQLDQWLWEFEPTSFVPHHLIIEQPMQASMLSAPVTLSPALAEGFDGVVLNLSTTVLPINQATALPERILEIITPDEVSKQQGRDKYRAYRDLGFELEYLPIK